MVRVKQKSKITQSKSVGNLDKLRIDLSKVLSDYRKHNLDIKN